MEIGGEDSDTPPDRVVFIGPLGETANGQHVASRAALECFKRAGLTVFEYVHESSDRLSPFLNRAIRQLYLLAMTVPAIHRARLESCRIYIPADSGLGLYRCSLQAVFASLIGVGVVLHHHSRAHVSRRHSAMMLLMRLGRNDMVLHITLCHRLRRAFVQTYGSCSPRVCVVSNRFMFAPDAENDHPPLPWSGSSLAHASRVVATRHEPLSIGMIAGLKEAKGVLVLLEALKRCDGLGIPVRVVLAGPARDAAAMRLIVGIERMRAIDGVWLGEIARSQLGAFFRELDLLVVPTQYRYEAEPLVIHEAHSHGVPVLAVGLGCIPEQIREGINGHVVKSSADFIRALIDFGRSPSRIRTGYSQKTITNHFKGAAEEESRLIAALTN